MTIPLVEFWLNFMSLLCYASIGVPVALVAGATIFRVMKIDERNGDDMTWQMFSATMGALMAALACVMWPALVGGALAGALLIGVFRSVNATIDKAGAFARKAQRLAAKLEKVGD